MKWITSFVLLILTVACSQGPNPQADSKPSANPTAPANPLEGKWKLVERKFDPDTVFVKTPDTVGYYKMITGNSFVWYNYDQDGSNLIGMAGGTYTLQGESYTEDIEFYYPPGVNILGTTIPFKIKVEDGKWHHSGFIQERELDEGVGDYVVTQERRLEEIWIKVE
ncbi:MAG: hypothetical protein AAFX87_22715 [Bacteroidota bacterium]